MNEQKMNERGQRALKSRESEKPAQHRYFASFEL
jgi:hypothetical protein